MIVKLVKINVCFKLSFEVDRRSLDVVGLAIEIVIVIEIVKLVEK